MANIADQFIKATLNQIYAGTPTNSQIKRSMERKKDRKMSGDVFAQYEAQFNAYTGGGAQSAPTTAPTPTEAPDFASFEKEYAEFVNAQNGSKSSVQSDAMGNAGNEQHIPSLRDYDTTASMINEANNIEQQREQTDEEKASEIARLKDILERNQGVYEEANSIFDRNEAEYAAQQGAKRQEEMSRSLATVNRTEKSKTNRNSGARRETLPVLDDPASLKRQARQQHLQNKREQREIERREENKLAELITPTKEEKTPATEVIPEVGESSKKAINNIGEKVRKQTEAMRQWESPAVQSGYVSREQYMNDQKIKDADLTKDYYATLTKEQQKDAENLFLQYAADPGKIKDEKTAQSIAYIMGRHYEAIGDNEGFQAAEALRKKTAGDVAAFGVGMGDVVSKPGMMIQSLVDKAKGGSFSDSYNERRAAIENTGLKEQNPLAYLGGEFAGNALMYNAAGGLLGTVAPISNAANTAGNAIAGRAANALQGLGKVGSAAANALRTGGGEAIGNVLTGMIPDILLDTFPTEAANIAKGMSAGEIAKDTGVNLLTNLGLNAGSELAPTLAKAAGKKVKGLFNSADDVADAAKQIPELESESVLDAAKSGKLYKGIADGRALPANRDGAAFGSVALSDKAYNSALAEYNALPAEGRKIGAIERIYKKIFKEKGNRRVSVRNVDFDGKPYIVDVNGSTAGELAKKGFSPEVAAAWSDVDSIIENGRYLNSAEVDMHGTKSKANVQRYDYFETTATIMGEPRSVRFDIEVYKDRNNYKTHRVLHEINLDETLSRSGVEPSGLAATPPLRGGAPTQPSSISDSMLSEAEPIVKNAAENMINTADEAVEKTPQLLGLDLQMFGEKADDLIKEGEAAGWSDDFWGEVIRRANSGELGTADQAQEVVRAVERASKGIPEQPAKEALSYGHIKGEGADRVAYDLDSLRSTVDGVRPHDANSAQKLADVKRYVDQYEAALKGDSVEEVNKARLAVNNALRRADSAMRKDPNYDFSLNKRDLTMRTTDAMNQFNDARPRTEQELADGVNSLLSGEEMSADDVRNLYDEMGAQREAVPTLEAKPAEPQRIPDIAEQDVNPGKGTVRERSYAENVRKQRVADVPDEVASQFVDQPEVYNTLRNVDTAAKAQASMDKGVDAARNDFENYLSAHDPAAIPLGHSLAKELSAQGDADGAANILRRMSQELTKSGQFSQAAAITMMKDDPMTAMQYAMKQIDDLNKQGAQRFKDKWKNFELTDAEKSLFDKIDPGDADGIKQAFDEIGKRLGKEYPTTMMDKILEGRKVSMLFNVRTNVRNVLANIPTLGMRWMSDRVEAVGQNIVHLINPDFKVTQSLTGSAGTGRKLAEQIFNGDAVKAMVDSTGGKYEVPQLKNSLMNDLQMFKGTRLEKWLNNTSGGAIEKLNKKLFGKEGVESIAETFRNATYKMLDLGDSPFVKENFVDRLGSYINAQGIKNIEDVPDEAIQMAWEEAMKATYKDNSWAVDMLRNVRGGIEKIPVVGRPLSQATIPFLQAPGNIAARMVDYSPVRGTKGVADIIKGAAAKNDDLIRKGIEEASKGLTGTGMVVLGVALHNAGILTGSYSEDKDQRQFEKQTGFREYALHVGDKYLTYDWAQPAAMPIMIGTMLADAIQKSDEYDSALLNYFGVEGSTAGKVIGGTKKGVGEAVNAWFNESPLQGLQDLLSGGGYGGSDVAGNIWDVGVNDFAQSFVPAAMNAFAKSVDPVQRNVTDKTNTFATQVNSMIAKIPGLSKTLPAKYDTWGREVKTAESKAGAAAAKFLVPGDYSYNKATPIDDEINRLYEQTGAVGVYPQVAPNKVGDKTLNNREVSALQKEMGEMSYQFADEFMKSSAYKDMNDVDRAEYLGKLYGAAKSIAQNRQHDAEYSSTYKKYAEAYDAAGGGEKGAKAVMQEVERNHLEAQAGVGSTSKAAEMIGELISEGKTKEAKAAASEMESLKAQGFDTADVGKYMDAKAEIPSLTSDGYKAVKDSGVSLSRYKQAAKVIPSLDGDDFVKQYNKLNMDGVKTITTEDFAAYLNRYGAADWERLAKAYGNDWSGTFEQDSSGQWRYKRAKKK